MQKELEKCELCPHRCKVNRNRNKNQIGRCKATSKIKLGLYSTHNFEEPCISGKKGSGTVFFSNCNFNCVYCQNYEISQLGKGKEGFVKFIEVALKIITYLLPVIQIISIVFCSGTAHIVLQFTGVVITMFGVLAFIVSVTQMKENWRAGVQKEEKTNLVTTGIYSISRNPAFLGFDLMYIGILLSFFNWFLCFATGFALVFFHLQIVNVEEDFLIEAFGNEYLQYKSKVCRYLGRKR